MRRPGLVHRLAAGLITAWLVATAVPAAESKVSRPFVGITLIERVESTPRPLRMHIAQIDTRAPGIRFKVSPPGGAREAVRQTTRDFMKAVGAQLAINAHFFLPFPSGEADAWVIGLAASVGRVYSAFETPEQSYALVADAPALNIDHRNRPRIVHRDARKADGLHVRERVRLWNTVAGSSQIVTEGRVTIPVYRDATHPRGSLAPGGPSGHSNERSWNDVTTARTVIGLSRDRRLLTLFTVDARGGSEGMRLGEIAALLIRDYGVWDAINLDGGGSTSLAWENPETGQAELVNTSADSPAGRAVASSLAVFARRHEEPGNRVREVRSEK